MIKKISQVINLTIEDFTGYETMDLENQIYHDLKRHEGCRLKAYKDTVGVWTIGYGHTKGVCEGLTISQEQADNWLREDMEEAIRDAKKALSGYSELDKVRKTVIVNMAFNLGYSKLSKFYSTLRSINAKQYEQASLHMLDSLWAKQVKQRATELAKRMSTGKIEKQHLA